MRIRERSGFTGYEVVFFLPFLQAFQHKFVSNYGSSTMVGPISTLDADFATGPNRCGFCHLYRNASGWSAQYFIIFKRKSSWTSPVHVHNLTHKLYRSFTWSFRFWRQLKWWDSNRCPQFCYFHHPFLFLGKVFPCQARLQDLHLMGAWFLFIGQTCFFGCILCPPHGYADWRSICRPGSVDVLSLDRGL